MGLDREIADYLSRVAELGPQPLSVVGPVRARENYRAGRTLRQAPDFVPASVASVRDERFDGLDGDRVSVRIYEPSDRIAATVLYFHGGGWVVGDLDTHDAQCRSLARDTGARVVSVDYRLAPEHPYPRPLSDCLAAVLWAADRWPQEKLAVAGDSAGGALAAGCALETRDTPGLPDLAAQMLVYPTTDPALRRPSVVAYGEGYGLTREDMGWFVDQYLPDEAARAHPAANLIARTDLAGAPPAIVVLAEYDVLHDEGADYAAHLVSAGVPVQVIEGRGLIHGFQGLVSISRESARVIGDSQAAFAALLAD